MKMKRKAFYHGPYFFAIGEDGEVYKGVDNKTTGYYSCSMMRADSLLVRSYESAVEYLRAEWPGIAKRLGLDKGDSHD